MKSRCPRYSAFVCVWVGLGWGVAVVKNDWCIIHRNKDEILDKVVFFISFISPILCKIIEEAKHNRLVIAAPPSASPHMGKGHIVLVPVPMIGIVVSVTFSCLRDLTRSNRIAEL